MANSKHLSEPAAVPSFGRRATDHLLAKVLAEHPEILTTGETEMPKALADAKAADRKTFEATHRPPAKHVPNAAVAAANTAKKGSKPAKSPDPSDPFGLAAKARGENPVDAAGSAVVESEHGNSAVANQDTTMTTNPVKTKQELDAEKTAKAIADKQAKADKAAKDKATRDAAAKTKADEKAAAKAKADSDKAAKKQADAEARDQKAAAARSGDGRAYTGTMLALNERVKSGVYVKGAHGQLRANDEVAIALDQVPADKVVPLIMEVLGETTNKYAALNQGQQSMNYRNRLRGAIKAGKVTLTDAAGVKTDKVVTLDTLRAARDAGNYAQAPVPKAPKPEKAAEAPAASSTPAVNVTDAGAQNHEAASKAAS